jgi:hypothetical protein
LNAHYFARFEQHNGSTFRFDTRIYLRESDCPGSGDTCVAAIIGKNPGSAAAVTFGSLAALSLGADNLLPTVKRYFTKAYADTNKPLPAGVFVRVWNLFYFCCPRLTHAIEKGQADPHAPICNSESDVPPIVWFAWGGSHPYLDSLKSRFRTKLIQTPFFFDKPAGCVATRIPAPADFARHTQGMKESPIVQFLANRL